MQVFDSLMLQNGQLPGEMFPDFQATKESSAAAL